MRRVEPVQRRLRYATSIALVVADDVPTFELNLGAPGSVAAFQFGITGFRTHSRWRLERISALFSTLNENPGLFTLTANGDTTETLMLMPGVPELDLGWLLPRGWTGTIVVTPISWSVSADSQSAMYVTAAFREEPPDAEPFDVLTGCNPS